MESPPRLGMYNALVEGLIFTRACARSLGIGMGSC